MDAPFAGTLPLLLTISVLGCSSSTSPPVTATPANTSESQAAATVLLATPTAAAVPTRVPTETFVDCPDVAEVPQTVCDFGIEVARIIVAGDVDRLAALMQEMDFVCPDPDATGLGGSVPLCDGAREGELRQGYAAANDVVGFALSKSQLGEWPLFAPLDGSASDTFGDSSLQLFTIGCPFDPAISCDESFVIVLSGIPFDSVRLVHFLFVHREPNSEPQIIRVRAIGLPPIGRAEWLLGGVPPDGFGDVSRFRYFAVR